MRCNWKVYAQEFAFAVNRLAGSAVQPALLDKAEPVSAFERKYRNSGQELYQVVYSTG
jgi:tRNA (guanine-N7-)-methyltransferase